MFGLSTNDTVILAVFIGSHAAAIAAYFYGLKIIERRRAKASAEFDALLASIPDDDDNAPA